MSSIGDLFLDLNLNTKPFDMQMQNVGNYAQKSMSRSFSGIGKIIAGAFATGAVVAFGKSCIDLGSNLAEVQNVVDVTFPHMNAQVNEFAKNAINQFGLSETVAKRMTGTYGAMAKAFGYSEKASYDMATSLTGLAGDVASFYNIDPTEAYTKLKSVFSGETETLKDLGIVMTQNALDQYALANGYGKTTAKMSEQEKVALRLAFVTENLSAAGGDFARTADSWANKTRVISLNFQSLKASIGQGLINVLSPVVSLINNIIVGLNKAVQYFVAFTSLLSGNKKTSATLGSVSSNIDKASSGAANLTNNVAGVGKAAKKAAKEVGALASFDDIKNIKISSDSDKSGSGDSGSGASGFGDDFNIAGGANEALDIDTSKMEASLNKLKGMWTNFTTFLSKNKAVILSLLAGIVAGFMTFEVLKNWGSIVGAISPLINTFKFLSLCVTTFFGEVAAGSGVMGGLTAVFGSALAPIVAISTVIAAVTASLVYLYQTSESFRNLVNEAVGNLLSILTSLWTGVLQPLFTFLGDVFVTVLVPLATFIATIFVSAVQAVATIALSLWNNILAPIAKFLVNVLSIALQGIINIWTAWKPAIEVIFEALNWIWQNMLQPLVDFITGIFCDGFKEWGDLINDLIPGITGIFEGFIEYMVGIFTLDITKVWSGIQKIFQGFDDFLTGIFKSDWSKTFGYLGESMNVVFKVISDVWSGIKKVFSGIVDFIAGVFTGNWKRAWNGVKSIFSGVFQALAGIAKAPINAVIGIINGAINGINKVGFDVPDWVPFIGGESFRINIPKIPMLAQGGYVKANTPQLAMIGDNKTQGEIVAPEGKMFEVMMNALQAYGAKNASNEDIQVLVSVMYEILEAVQNLQLTVDGDSLNDDSKKRDRERALRTGKLILE